MSTTDVMCSDPVAYFLQTGTFESVIEKYPELKNRDQLYLFLQKAAASVETEEPLDIFNKLTFSYISTNELLAKSPSFLYLQSLRIILGNKFNIIDTFIKDNPNAINFEVLERLGKLSGLQKLLVLEILSSQLNAPCMATTAVALCKLCAQLDPFDSFGLSLNLEETPREIRASVIERTTSLLPLFSTNVYTLHLVNFTRKVPQAAYDEVLAKTTPLLERVGKDCYKAQILTSIVNTLSEESASILQLTAPLIQDVLEKAIDQGCLKTIFQSTAAIPREERASVFEHFPLIKDLNVYRKAQILYFMALPGITRTPPICFLIFRFLLNVKEDVQLSHVIYEVQEILQPEERTEAILSALPFLEGVQDGNLIGIIIRLMHFIPKAHHQHPAIITLISYFKEDKDNVVSNFALLTEVDIKVEEDGLEILQQVLPFGLKILPLYICIPKGIRIEPIIALTLSFYNKFLKEQLPSSISEKAAALRDFFKWIPENEWDHILTKVEQLMSEHPDALLIPELIRVTALIPFEERTSENIKIANDLLTIDIFDFFSSSFSFIDKGDRVSYLNKIKICFHEKFSLAILPILSLKSLDLIIELLPSLKPDQELSEKLFSNENLRAASRAHIQKCLEVESLEEDMECLICVLESFKDLLELKKFPLIATPALENYYNNSDDPGKSYAEFCELLCIQEATQIAMTVEEVEVPMEIDG